MTWTLQDAKNRFSEVVTRALDEGPQTITRRGKETVVLVSAERFRAWTSGTEDLVDFVRKSPLRGVQLDLTRPRDHGREVAL